MIEQTTQLVKNNKGFILFILLMVVFRTSLADWNRVPTGSMKPTIVEGDHIIINKLAYDLNLPLTQVSIATIAHPQRGDIIVFNSKTSRQRLVKRVIGVPGDQIEMRDNILYLNQQRLSYSNSSETSISRDVEEDLFGHKYTVRTAKNAGAASNFGPVVVPPARYFVLGDNRDNSADSRFIGFIPREEIIGRSSSVAFSLNPDNYYMPRSERFIKPL